MKLLSLLLSWLILLSTPFFLITTAIRMTITPLYPEFEYRTPNFPDDTYGFTLKDRLFWSKPAINYLINKSPISYLGDLKFEDGSPLYNERELSHMVDVKNLVGKMVTFWTALLVFYLGTAVFAWRFRWLKDFWRSFSRGGWLTISLIVAGILGVLLSFNTLFTGFHQLFFTTDTWTFYYSDTLIRLFPIRFWQDAFILVAILTLLGAGTFIVIGKKFTK